MSSVIVKEWKFCCSRVRFVLWSKKINSFLLIQFSCRFSHGKEKNYLQFFHSGEVPIHGAIVFCFCLTDCTRWGFNSTMSKNICLNFRWRCHFNTLIAQKGSLNSEINSSWDSKNDGFSKNFVMDKQQEGKLFWAVA